jgi:hypothetical protein
MDDILNIGTPLSAVEWCCRVNDSVDDNSGMMGEDGKCSHVMGGTTSGCDLTPPLWLFVGEGTSPDHYFTAHGAYETGMDRARDILRCKHENIERAPKTRLQ